MKKLFILSALTGITAFNIACDPVEDEYSNNGIYVTADDIKAIVTVEQKDGKSINLVNIDANGNSTPIQVSNGVSTLMTTSAAKMLLFSEGKNTVYVRAMNPDGSVVEKAFEVNVDEMTEPVPPQYKLFTDLAEKKWTWDTELNGGGWGNAGQAGDGKDLALNGGGTWWACPPADLAGQTQHMSSHKPCGEEHPDAYMVWSLNGMKIKTFTPEGNVVHSGTFSFDMSKKTEGWSIGTLNTSAESILFPWQINGNGYAPTAFDIMQLNEEKLVLVYTTAGMSSWGECTWWRFKSPDHEATFDGFSANPDEE